jgi:hypothetical protein
MMGRNIAPKFEERVTRRMGSEEITSPAALGKDVAANEGACSSPRISCWQIPDGVGDRVRTEVTLHELAEQFDDRPWACEQADAVHLFGGILCHEDGDLDQVAVNAPVESDDVSSVGVWELLHVPGHPIASECCLKDLGYNGVPPDLIGSCRQDRRMKDNVLIEGGYRSRKIASFQRSCEGSLGHSRDSHVVGKSERLKCDAVDLSVASNAAVLVSSTKSAAWSLPAGGVRRQ